MMNNTIKLAHGNIYYESGGAGETLVLVHAGFVDSGMWDQQWADLTSHYRVIRYDLTGFGKSDPLQAPTSRREELFAVLKHLEVEQAYLLGCSLGGEIVLDFALDHPEMVTGLILVSAVPGGFAMQGEPPPDLLAMFGAMQEGNLAAVSELQLRLWVDGGSRQPDQIDAQVRQHAAQMNQIAVQNGTWGMDAEPLNPLTPPAATRLHEIAAPTLIIDGALDHPEILRAGEVMAAEISGARQVVIADTAHSPNMEKPTEFNALVLNFLRS